MAAISLHVFLYTQVDLAENFHCCLQVSALCISVYLSILLLQRLAELLAIHLCD